MDQLNLPPETKTGKPEKKWTIPLSAVWVISTIIFCVIFAFTITPRAKAQTREQDPTSQYTAVIRNVFDFIQRHYVDETDPKVLYEGAMTGMFNSLGDPYTVFLPESQMSDLNDTTQGNFGGVGLFITKQVAPRDDGQPNYLEVAAPIEDTPGWRAGINPGDLIIQINDETTDKITSDEAVAKLRGQPGTEVKLIIRRGERVEFPVTLTRAIIEVPTVKHDMIGNIGYLKLLTFTPMTVDRSQDAIQDFQSKGYKGVILDLRNNYGGLLNAAVGICNLFVEGGVVVSTKSRIVSENQVFYARGKAMVPADIPVIVLINRGSASASEIVAGALKDRGRAYLVGEKSFGKGSVQQVFPLDKAGFKITTARYFTPSDVNIDKIGIPPDREVLFPDFTAADAETLNTLINSGKITDFVKANPNANIADVKAFAQALNKDYNLDTTLLQRLIRNEQNRTTIAPVYDLDYDVQLQEAVKILRQEDFKTLMQTSKTLKTLQDEATKDNTPAQAS
ncbi:MAG: S41 family peptidase [Treponema sp.]|nr:S41 family peptidase [Treponema sp.]